MENLKLNSFVWSLLVTMMLGFSSCLDSDLVGDNYTTFTGTMMGKYFEDNPEFSEFTAALKKVNALPLLYTYGKYTCFAPTNAAMQAYYASKGKTLDQLDSVELKEMVYYHIIDGETAGTETFTTSDYDVFGKGALTTKNMIGRYIYTSLSNGVWLVDKTTKILSPDNELINGVVHVIDKVLEGNKDLLPDFIAADSRFSIFSQALQETGLADSLKLVDDPSYSHKGETFQWIRGIKNTTFDFPSAKKYGYTALMESDSIMKLKAGIEDYNGLVAYAASIYDRMYPEDKNITDVKNRKNSLNRFVAYHLLYNKLPTTKFVYMQGYSYSFSSEYISNGWFSFSNSDNKYIIEQYQIPMMPNALIAVQYGNYFNETRNAFSAEYKNLLPLDDNVVKFIAKESNNDCLNGMYHSLNNMLVYTPEIEKYIAKKRIRMEVRTFLPELENNDLILTKYYRGGKVIPSAYCKNMTYNEESKVHVLYSPPNVHPYMYGDEMYAYGFFDLTLKVGPIPAGKYEVRVGYSTRLGHTQVYFDGQPCGIPINQNVTGLDPSIGYEAVYNDALLYAPNELKLANEDDPYGYENDKLLRNRGYMKAPNSTASTVYHNNSNGINTGYTARNTEQMLRKILGVFSFSETSTHNLRVVQMDDGEFLLDYIEFMPVELIDSEDIH